MLSKNVWKICLMQLYKYSRLIFVYIIKMYIAYGRKVMINSENLNWSNSAGWWRVLPYVAYYRGIVPVPSFIWYKYLYLSALTSWAFSKLISRCKYCLPSQSIGKPSGMQRKNKDFLRVPVKLSNTVTLRFRKRDTLPLSKFLIPSTSRKSKPYQYFRIHLLLKQFDCWNVSDHYQITSGDRC